MNDTKFLLVSMVMLGGSAFVGVLAGLLVWDLCSSWSATIRRMIDRMDKEDPHEH